MLSFIYMKRKNLSQKQKLCIIHSTMDLRSPIIDEYMQTTNIMHNLINNIMSLKAIRIISVLIFFSRIFLF